MVVVLGGIGFYGFLPFYADADFTFFGDTSTAAPVFVVLGYAIAIGIIAAIIGLLVLLFVRRDVGVAYVAIAGLIVRHRVGDHLGADLGGRLRRRDGLRARTSSSPRSSRPALTSRRRSSNRASSPDPIDKTLTFFIVFVILQTLSRRFVARFPQGEKAIGLEEAYGVVGPGHPGDDLDPDDAARSPGSCRPRPARTTGSTR